MVDWAGSHKGETPLKQNSVEELLELLKLEQIKHGKAGFSGKVLSEAEKELLARGIGRGQLRKYKEACYDIGRFERKPVRRCPAGGLPVNTDIQGAIERARDLEVSIQVKLRKKKA